MKGTGHMDNDEYEILSNDTHNIGLIVCLDEFDAEGGNSGRITPVVQDIERKIDDGHAIARVSFFEPLQPPAGYRYIAKMLRDIADDCEKAAAKHEEGGEHDLDNTSA